MIARDYEKPVDKDKDNVYKVTIIATDGDKNTTSKDLGVTLVLSAPFSSTFSFTQSVEPLSLLINKLPLSPMEEALVDVVLEFLFWCPEALRTSKDLGVTVKNVFEFVSKTITFDGLDYITLESPITGKIWLDRNLGATQASLSAIFIYIQFHPISRATIALNK
jgi:hypothetical protein